MALNKVLKHQLLEDGLVIKLMWFDFRKKHNIRWSKVKTKSGKICHIPTWPQDVVEFNRLNGVRYVLIGNGKFAKTPDGRVVEMKDIHFRFPSKDIAALFKISFL